MKKSIIALSLSVLSVTTVAQEKKSESEFSVTGNLAMVSDYRFRGISQTDKKPAGQGELSVAHKSGLYVGAWTSNVSQWTAAGASLETDLYGGYKGTLPMDVGFDVGYVAYQYPGNTANPKNNTREIYLGLSKGVLGYKLYRSRGNWFGLDNANGSLYHELSLSYALMNRLSMAGHLGLQNLKNREEDFKDYEIGLSYDLGDSFALGLTFTNVSFKAGAAGQAWFTNAAGKKLYGNGTVLSLTKTF